MKLAGCPGRFFSDLEQIKGLEKKAPEKALKKACQEFEAIFLYQVLKGLEKIVPQDGLFKKSLSQDIYQDLFFQEMSNRMAKRGIGLARILYESLSRQLHPARKTLEARESLISGGKGAIYEKRCPK